jgi:nicotinamide riboside kinase
MKRGVVVGAFSPPHAGDLLLIDVARAGCDALTIAVCAKEGQSIAGALRVAWLRELVPDAEIVLVDDRLDVLDPAPDLVFTAEQHDSRSSLLPPAVQAYYVPRVVLAGAESTGKTTLARALAERFALPWVAEYGRDYTEMKYRDGMATDAWTTAEFVHIAREQERREDAAARCDAPLVICDTDAFVTRLWYERYLGTFPALAAWPLDRARERIYLVPEPDVAFVQDRIRDGEEYRARMHDRTLEELRTGGRVVHVLAGSYDERTQTAFDVVQALLERG